MQVINWKYWCIRKTIVSLSHGKSVSCISLRWLYFDAVEQYSAKHNTLRDDPSTLYHVVYSYLDLELFEALLKVILLALETNDMSV